MTQPTGLLIVGHGTRSERGRAEFVETVELVSRLARDVPTVACYLELAQPTIAQGIAQLAARGVQRIVVLPLLLFAAGHAKQDIPEAVCAAAGEFPQIEFSLAGHLGCHERLLCLSGRRYEEACLGHDDVAPQDTLWLMVGRGSNDASATAELERFVELRQQLTPVAAARIGYLAMAQPDFRTLLPEIAELRFRRIVVQPHLLFHGELADIVAREVTAMAERWPHQQWLVTPYLGAAELLAEAIFERFCEACLLEGVR